MENIEERIEQCIEVLEKYRLRDNVSKEDILQYTQLIEKGRTLWKEQHKVNNEYIQKSMDCEEELMSKNPDGRYTANEWANFQAIKNERYSRLSYLGQEITETEKKIRTLEEKINPERIFRVFFSKEYEAKHNYLSEIGWIDNETERAKKYIEELEDKKEKAEKDNAMKKEEFSNDYKKLRILSE